MSGVLTTEQYRVRNVNRRAERKLMCVELLGGKCADCPFDDLTRPEVFQFDHLPGTEKLGNIGHMLLGAKKRLLAELGKCELVCSNCHVTRTCYRRGDTSMFRETA